MDEIRERLAELAHQQWTGWMRYFFQKCQWNDDGSITVPAAYVTALYKQMDTPYEKLSKLEQDSDRAEADKMLAVINREH